MSVICYELNEESKKDLMKRFPPKYPAVRYDHVTIEMGGPYARTPEAAQSVQVVGIADDGHGIEALIVKVNGTSKRPRDNRFWHITASFDPDKIAPADFDVLSAPDKKQAKPYRPVTSNGFLSCALDENGSPRILPNSGWTVKLFDMPILIQTHPTVQFDRHELELKAKKGHTL